MLIKKNCINRFARTFGFEINRVRNFPTFRSLLRDFLNRFQVDCVFDAGANNGGYGEFLRGELNFKGLIISFEPVPSTFRQLQKAAEGDSNWIACPLALGSKDGTLKINITSDSSFSSFLIPTHQTISKFQGQNEVRAEEEVPIRRLDSLFNDLKARYPFQNPFLKMDTQGYDREVLAGAKGVLSRLVGLQSEISLLPIYQGMPTITDMHPEISNAGFDLVGLYPINRDDAGRWIEADSVYLRRKLAEQPFVESPPGESPRS